MARHSKCPFHLDWKWKCSEFWAMQKPYIPKTGLELNIHKPKKNAQMQINTPIKTNWKKQNTIFRSMCNPWCFKWCFLHSIKLASQTSCFTFPGASNVLGISFQQSPVATRQNSNINAHLKDMANQRANVWLRVLLGGVVKLRPMLASCEVRLLGVKIPRLCTGPFGFQRYLSCNAFSTRHVYSVNATINVVACSKACRFSNHKGKIQTELVQSMMPLPTQRAENNDNKDTTSQNGIQWFACNHIPS